MPLTEELRAMPLEKGSSQEVIGHNIATELRAHPSMDPKQAAAIAYSNARGDDVMEGEAKDDAPLHRVLRAAAIMARREAKQDDAHVAPHPGKDSVEDDARYSDLPGYTFHAEPSTLKEGKKFRAHVKDKDGKTAYLGYQHYDTEDRAIYEAKNASARGPARDSRLDEAVAKADTLSARRITRP
jgi:hypothetical protein